MFFCSSLLCFLIPFSYAFDTLAHILAAVQHVARSVMACRWVGLLQSCDKQITEQINESKPEVRSLIWTCIQCVRMEWRTRAWNGKTFVYFGNNLQAASYCVHDYNLQVLLLIWSTDRMIQLRSVRGFVVFIPSWIMATNSQPQETPEYHAFRENYDRLYHAIQDPLSLATRLFARSIITFAVTGRMIAVGLSTLEKNGILLSAVEMQIRTDPRMFYEFLSALKEDPTMQSLVESMHSKCFIGNSSLPPPILVL